MRKRRGGGGLPEKEVGGSGSIRYYYTSHFPLLPLLLPLQPLHVDGYADHFTPASVQFGHPVHRVLSSYGQWQPMTFRLQAPARMLKQSLLVPVRKNKSGATGHKIKSSRTRNLT